MVNSPEDDKAIRDAIDALRPKPPSATVIFDFMELQWLVPMLYSFAHDGSTLGRACFYKARDAAVALNAHIPEHMRHGDPEDRKAP